MQNSSYDHEWAQNYEKITLDETMFHATDDQYMAANNMTGQYHHRELSPKISCSNNNNGPKGSIGKPIKRRSRSSKKAPTTLLNANKKNFRALVQQYTGCSHNAGPAFGASKGPITLNFAQYNYASSTKYESQHQHDQKDDHSFFGMDSIYSNSTTTTNDQVFSTSTIASNPRLDTLTVDDFDIENFSYMSGPHENYSALISGIRNDDFWGF